MIELNQQTTQESTVTENDNNQFMKRMFRTRSAGHTIGKLIAERRNNRGSLDHHHKEKLHSLARKLSFYEGILMDPFNQNRRLNITRLIACIDQGK